MSGRWCVCVEQHSHQDTSQAGDAVINSAGTVTVNATNSAVISSAVVSAALSVGVGGSTGVGASIGVAVAKNLIGYEADGDAGQALVEASSTNTSITCDR